VNGVAAVVDDQVVRAIVDQVWESLLAALAVPCSGPYDEVADPATALTAEVTLTGDWNGVVRLRCDHATARSLARAMLAIDLDADLFAADVEDAVGEVVNVVGGNVKGTLAGTTALGLPRVGEADLVPATGPAARCLVDWRGRPS